MSHALIPLRSRLLLLMAAAPMVASALAAADLPVTAVTMTPQGAVVTRSGDLPAGDDTVTGIPAAISSGPLLVAVAGLDLPAWHLALPAPAVDAGPHADPAKVAELRAALATAQDARALADLRARLANAAVRPVPAADADPGEDKGAPPVIPTPAALQARLDFATANATRATADAAAADAAVILAQRKLDALYAASARDVPPTPAALVIPGAGGHHVDLTYRVTDATWGPAYRVEVTGDHVRLVLLARANLGAGADRWGAVPIDFTTRPPDHPAILPALEIPQLGLGDTVEGIADPREPASRATFGSRSGGGRKRASEYKTDGALHAARIAQSADGTWGSEPYRNAATALRTLSFLGAGFDQLTPNKYRPVVHKAIDALVASDNRSLDDLALTTWALAEAFAMTGDQAIKDVLTRDVTDLRNRAFKNGGLADVLSAGGADAPLVAAHVASALKSAFAASIDIGDGLILMRASLPLVESCRDRVLGRLAGAYIRIFTGEHPQIPLTEAQLWTSMVPEWFASGHAAFIELAAIDLFQTGGSAWDVYNNTTRDFLIRHQDEDGSFHVPDTACADIAEAECTLSLEIYYRYAQVKKSGEHEEAEADSDLGGAGAFRAVGGGGGADVVSSYGPFAPIPDGASAKDSSHGWPLHWTAPNAISLTPGARAEIGIASADLPGAVELSAIPQQATSVWRALHSTNPQNQPLPAAAAEVVVDGTPCGTTQVPFTLPGKPLVLALGRESQLRIERAATAKTDDGLRTRTLHVQIGYRLVAPPGWTRHVDVIEPMPFPDPEVTLAVPGLDDKQLHDRLTKDPLWHFDVSPGVVPVLSFTLAYSASVRPYLEYQQ